MEHAVIRVKFAVQEVPTRTPSSGEGRGYHRIHSNSDRLPRLVAKTPHSSLFGMRRAWRLAATHISQIRCSLLRLQQGCCRHNLSDSEISWRQKHKSMFWCPGEMHMGHLEWLFLLLRVRYHRSWRGAGGLILTQVALSLLTFTQRTSVTVNCIQHQIS